MTAAKCQRCASWWSHQGGHERRFKVITRLCPACIAQFPAMGLAPLSCMKIHTKPKGSK